MAKRKTATLSGKENGERIESRILEERIQEAVAKGARHLEIDAFGQHGIGGRLFQSVKKPISVHVTGTPGQRLGSMGFPGTTIESMGPASNDTGWLNAGAEIIVRGNAGDGCCNAMAQGKVFIDGCIGARGMTMTKVNPRRSAPELWVLGSVGDYFAEFMAGGVAVVCGLDPRDPDNVLGYRPCVGMVGGKIFFRGSHQGFSRPDSKLTPISDEDWDWLKANLREFLKKLGKLKYSRKLSRRKDWQLLTAKTPFERISRKRRSVSQFRSEIWDGELGRGGLIGDLDNSDRTPVPLITTGVLRRYVPVWENLKYAAPCQSACPTGIPVRERWKLIRAGKHDQALELAMAYTPLPATVCGHLCPNLCMEHCTRGTQKMTPVDVSALGKASIGASLPDLPPVDEARIAIIGGGPAGMSVAWQLRLLGHEPVVYDMDKELGGKISSAIPGSRIPPEVLGAELERIRKVIGHVQLDSKLDRKGFDKLRQEFDFVVIAAGAQKPRVVPVPGKERLVPALDFLRRAKAGKMQPGKRLVVIGAGNVGCDVATVAAELGAEEMTLIDIQEPASFGKERQAAEAAGATFRWPCFTKEVTAEGVVLTNGELLPADTVVISIGDQPDLDFLSDTIATERGFVTVNDIYQTTEAHVFAVGDIVRPGLITDAIGAGRKAAQAIDAILAERRPASDTREMVEHSRVLLDYVDRYGETSETIDYTRMSLEYFDPRVREFKDLDACAGECSSCGECRDCGLCATICPQAAISRVDLGDGKFEMRADPDKCIGCGFCADGCPCGIWNLVANDPL